MKKSPKTFHHILLLILIAMLTSSCGNTFAQDKKPYVRIVKMAVDSLQLDYFSEALKEHAEVTIKKDPGVSVFYAVYDKERPNNVTIFEIYTNVAAYESHIQTADHIKYISSVKNMVQSLVLTDVIPIALETKLK